MKSFLTNSRLLTCILFAFFLLNTQFAKAQSKVQNCAANLISMNKIPNGIPSARITEYEDCVASLDETPQSKTNNKGLLNDCYNKLISYFGALDKETKVNEYKAKLRSLPYGQNQTSY